MVTRTYSLNCITGMQDYYFFIKFKNLKKRKEFLMFKIIILSALISIMLQLNVTAGSKCRTSTLENYALEIFPANNNGLFLIKFKISSDCFVKIKVTDETKNIVESLVENEMNEGIYSINYKQSEKINRDICKCIMEVYDSKGKMIFSKEKEISAIK